MDDQIIVKGEDFIASVPSSSSEPVIVTSFEDKLSEYEKNLIIAATDNFNSDKKMYSAYYPGESASTATADLNTIDTLANGIQTTLSKVLEANELVRKYILTDDIIGRVYESIESNVNTGYRLSYKDVSGDASKGEKLAAAKLAVDKFLRQINIKHIIRESIPLTYAEGNAIYCLRYDGSTYVVDRYPLGTACISDYRYGGKPIVYMDMRQLESLLKKTYSKTKKNKALFFESIRKDIEHNYPREVYRAYEDKENIVRLDTKYTGVMQVGSLGRKYGVSPIVRALKSALMLQNYESTDYINAKARGKKILLQKMRKEIMGKDYTKLGFEIQSKAHNDLMNAWQARTVVTYTAIPQVEDLKWVVDTTADTNSDKINIYRSKIMSTLGIGFIDNTNANFSIANISLDQLMKTINSISEQLEDIVRDWLCVMFENENIDTEYLPEIQIIDAEAMDMAVKKDLVELLYSKLNCSMDTCLNILGMSVQDEKQKRIAENIEGYDTEIFMPHASQYTSSASSEAGRPATSENTDKQSSDKEYTKNVRE